MTVNYPAAEEEEEDDYQQQSSLYRRSHHEIVSGSAPHPPEHAIFRVCRVVDKCTTIRQ